MQLCGFVLKELSCVRSQKVHAAAAAAKLLLSYLTL